MNAYNELYLDDAMHNLADMLDYAICDLNYEPDEFFSWFINSGIASKFEKGNPKYITGMSGAELCEAVLKATNIDLPDIPASNPDFKDKEYWAGWVLAVLMILCFPIPMRRTRKPYFWIPPPAHCLTVRMGLHGCKQAEKTMCCCIWMHLFRKTSCCSASGGSSPAS